MAKRGSNSATVALLTDGQHYLRYRKSGTNQAAGISLVLRRSLPEFMASVIYKVGDDISTDVIYPGRYMATVLPTETPLLAFADDATFNARLKAKQIPPGSVIVGGQNFGCGSSREQAVSCLKGHELIIVAKSFARIFLQNAINLGLRVVSCPMIEANEADELEVSASAVINHSSGKEFFTSPLPKSRQVIIDAGGLIPFTRKRVLEAAAVR
jgi:3-isopropylmalate/(R)-2-methylmalate dehydratase small subunit